MVDILTWQRRLSPILGPLGKAYGALMTARRAAYEQGHLPSYAPFAPCVSVGNIGWGGAGKTPITDWLLTWAEGRALKACVLSRGYKAVPPKPPYLVRPDSDPKACGDEPLMLAARHEQSYVLVDPKRSRAAVWADEMLAPHVYFLDDGFQHLAVKRHLDLVLLRPEDLRDQWNKVIPAGSWREPESALARADAFLVKARPEVFDKLRDMAELHLGKFGRPIFSFHLEPTGLRDVASGVYMSAPGAGPYSLLTATADPHAVRRSATRYMGQDPVEHMAYPDHHQFSKRDWLDARDSMHFTSASRLICTAKDAVKLARLGPEFLYSLEVEVVFGESLLTDVSFEAWWREAWTRISNNAT